MKVFVYKFYGMHEILVKVTRHYCFAIRPICT